MHTRPALKFSPRRLAAWACAAGLLAAGGCSRSPAPPTAAPAPASSNSTARQAIEGFTGKTAVDAGQRAKAQIKDISARHDRELEEVME